MKNHDAEKQDMKKSRTGFFRTLPGRAILAVLLLTLFVLGYGLTSGVMIVRSSRAATLLPLPAAGAVAPIGEVPCPWSVPMPPWSCDNSASAIPISASTALMTAMEKALQLELMAAAGALEGYIGNWLVDGMMTAMLERFNQAELNLIEWWNTFWFYNMYPALQDMVKQTSVSGADQVRTLQSSGDSQVASQVQQKRQEFERETARVFNPSEGVCPVATAVGGQVRALTIGNSMRKAWQNEFHARGLNKQTTINGQAVSASGRVFVTRARVQRFKDIFCDPDGDGGQLGNFCKNTTAPADPKKDFRNADTQITKRFLNALTIDVANPDPDIGPKNAATVEAQIENMMGDTSMDPIPGPIAQSSAGRVRWISRRSYLTRHAGAESVPLLIAGRKMPGSQLGPWVAALRKAAGIPDGEISANPSYREVVHALTVDRFNSGRYATMQVTEEAQIQREKLVQETLYLMQLRDYYELLERTALTLAVQVSVLADERPLPDVQKIRPF